MMNDRMLMRVAMLFALAVLPSLVSAQPSPSSQAKVPDWFGMEVTQIAIDGSSEQLKAFQEELPTFVQKALADQTIFQSPTSKNKLVYSYLTETEKKFGESTVTGFYSALKAATEKTKDAQKPLAMQTSIFMVLGCRIFSCAGQLAWKGPMPPCDC
jgi:hypothetical protein